MTKVSEAIHPMKQKKPVVRLLAFSLPFFYFLAIPLSASSQPTISATSHSVSTGDDVLVSINVTDYKKILSTQFTLNWDPSVIQLKSISNIGLNARVQDNFGQNKVADGELTFFWYDPTLAGVTVSDDQPLFDLSFNVLGAQGTCTTLAFTDSPTIREVVDTTAKKVEAVFTNGEIVVGQQCLNVSTSSLAFATLQLGDAFPNPSSEGFAMSVYAAKKVDGTVLIYDALGRMVQQFSQALVPGEQTLIIAKTLFPQAGIYHIQIRVNEEYYTQKLVVL